MKRLLNIAEKLINEEIDFDFESRNGSLAETKLTTKEDWYTVGFCCSDDSQEIDLVLTRFGDVIMIHNNEELIFEILKFQLARHQADRERVVV